jgi:hypothetical protein
MKFLFIDNQLTHHKNRAGFHLMCKEGNIDVTISQSHEVFSNDWDLVFIPYGYFDPAAFPNAKHIMYGPHNFVFVEGIWKNGHFPKKCFYNILSTWVDELEKEMGGIAMQTISMPFAVDVERFSPKDASKQYDCFVYFKRRHSSELKFVLSELARLNLTFKVIVYGQYNENDYIETIRMSKFGIWLGCHESQGFALQECLSHNTPLLVWDVHSMFEEYNNDVMTYQNYKPTHKLKGTSAPYWESSCGILFSDKHEFVPNLETMRNTYQTFQPRQYIVDTLSPKACINRLISFLNGEDTEHRPSHAESC